MIPTRSPYAPDLSKPIHARRGILATYLTHPAHIVCLHASTFSVAIVPTISAFLRTSRLTQLLPSAVPSLRWGTATRAQSVQNDTYASALTLMRRGYARIRLVSCSMLRGLDGGEWQQLKQPQQQPQKPKDPATTTTWTLIVTLAVMMERQSIVTTSTPTHSVNMITSVGIIRAQKTLARLRCKRISSIFQGVKKTYSSIMTQPTEGLTNFTDFHRIIAHYPGFLRLRLRLLFRAFFLLSCPFLVHFLLCHKL